MIHILMNLLDNLLSKKITCSIGDIMLKGKGLDEGQLTVITRYHDAEMYSVNGNKSFRLQNVLSKILWGEKHDEKTGNQTFTDLIESYKATGYNMNSYIQLDKHLSLMNGTHRVALNMYFGYWQVSAIIKGRSIFRKRI